MKHLDLFGSTFQCDCGRTHTITPREIVYADDAIARLPDLASRAAAGADRSAVRRSSAEAHAKPSRSIRRVAVLTDVRTRAAAGEKAVKTLRAAGWRVTEIRVPDPAPGKSPVCDDLTRAAIEPEVGEADLILPVGAGVLSDLGKWIACDTNRPFLPLATAASMNGYASSNIAPTIKGVKRLLYARAPYAVAADPKVLLAAPRELTVSGLGDVLAKSVSSADWYFNHALWGDYYCPQATGLIAEIEPLYLDNPAGIRDGNPAAMEALFSALLLTGVAMTMAETSFPSSGGEHLISHALDMMSSVDGVAHDLHGRQVGIGTIIASELYRRILAVEKPRFVAPPAEIDKAFWGPIAGMVAEEYALKRERLESAPKLLGASSAWDNLRAALAPMVRPPERLRDCLRTAGGATTAADLGMDRQRLLAALRHAHEIRSRFTCLDLAALLGILPAAAEEIVGQWA